MLRSCIDDERVLAAIASVPRELFVARTLRSRAWENRPLPIGAGQTISQPLIVARMCEALELSGDEHILDVGGGSGYHAAILGRLGRSVVSMERHPALAEQARRNLAAAAVENVTLVNVAAAAHQGLPRALLEQLAPIGRLIAPVDGATQRLVLAKRASTAIQFSDLGPVQFVPLEQGPARRS